MFPQPWPLFMFTCHCTLGTGSPEAAAVKVAADPDATTWLTGCVVTCGASGATESPAATLTADPTEFTNTASYSYPLSAVVAVNE